MSEPVYLKCIKEGSKLRVKIISPGFFHEANCQFPRDIRVEGRKYSVPLNAISFAEGPNHKFFYRISKSYIKIINVQQTTQTTQTEPILPDKIFEDVSVTECIICMGNDKETVFAKCGHYACCEQCSMIIFHSTKKCPICRSRIDSVVKRDQIQI